MAAAAAMLQLRLLELYFFLPGAPLWSAARAPLIKLCCRQLQGRGVAPGGGQGGHGGGGGGVMGEGSSAQCGRGASAERPAIRWSAHWLEYAGHSRGGGACRALISEQLRDV